MLIRRSQKKKGRKRFDSRDIVKKYLRLLNYPVEQESLLRKKINHVSFTLTLLYSIFIIIKMILKHTWLWGIINLLIAFTIIYVLIRLFCWAIFFFYLDIKRFNRAKEIEEVFPDFLMLVSSNINAGMTIDRAITLAARSRFGALSEEIEIITKKTIGGMDIEDALQDFAHKYNSDVIKKSISLIIKALESGGKVSEVLNRVAMDIQENRILHKEMAANVTTYAIFIAIASLIGAPFLFALATQLISVMQSILSNINISGVSTSLTINISGDVIDLSAFRKYAFISLFFTSIMSSSLISMIRHGNIKKGWKNIPLFIFVSIIIYTFSSFLMGKILFSIMP